MARPETSARHAHIVHLRHDFVTVPITLVLEDLDVLCQRWSVLTVEEECCRVLQPLKRLLAGLRSATLASVVTNFLGPHSHLNFSPNSTYDLFLDRVWGPCSMIGWVNGQPWTGAGQPGKGKTQILVVMKG